MRLCMLSICALAGLGCGDQHAPQANHAAGDSATTSSTQLPTASMRSPVDTGTDLNSDQKVLVAAQEILPQPSDRIAQLLDEIQQLRIAPFPEDAQAARTARRTRNQKIVQLSSGILRLAASAESPEPIFDSAISHLLEARYQLALGGVQEDVNQLYADVQALSDRAPESDSTANGVYYLAMFAHANARLKGESELIWFSHFSRWAREFADRFPNQKERAVSLLFGAGRSCEMHAMVSSDPSDAAQLMTDARLCYSSLAHQFSETSEGQEAAAVLRRISLPGKTLSQFAGPTLDGQYVDCEDFRDKVTVVYFWDSRNAEFNNQMLPLLRQALDAAGDQLRFVGVNMDDDKTQVETFIIEHAPPGVQIFFQDDKQRSWNSPLIRFWGVSRSPSVWLIDRAGTVAAVDVGHAQLVTEMRTLFRR